MKEAGFVWDADKLERFMANPDAVVSGNSMKPFSGLASADDRAKIVAFLQSAATRKWDGLRPTKPITSAQCN